MWNKQQKIAPAITAAKQLQRQYNTARSKLLLYAWTITNQAVSA